MQNNNNLTDEQYWNEFWRSVSLPSLVEEDTQWHLALSQVFKKMLPRNASLKLFEVGCAPGRWLVWFNKTLGCQVSGCDNSSLGVDVTRKNLLINQVNGEIHQIDFLSSNIKEKFDMSLSLGVIEHFDDPSELIERQYQSLKSGGYLLLEVPNMAGRFNLTLLKMAKMNDLLKRHNLNVINLEYFKSIAEKYNLEIQFLDYVGGFDLGLIVYNHPYGKSLKRPLILYFLCALNRLFRKFPSFFLKLNSGACSSMILAILKK